MTTEALQILESVHNYYSTAFSNLVVYTVSLLAFAGVLVPFAIQFYNNRAQASERTANAELVKTEVQKALTELRESLKIEIAKTDKLIDEKLSKFDQRMEKKLKGIEAGTFHIQGNHDLTQRNYDRALLSFCTAGKLYIVDDNEIDLQKMIKAITESSLPRISAKQFEENNKLQKGVDQFVEKLTAYNSNRRYSLSIDAVKSALELSLKRNVPASTNPPIGNA